MAADNQFIPDPLITASTARDGSGATLLFTAAAEAYLYEVRVQGLGNNPRSVCRVWLNNGSDPTTATNNVLIAEVGLGESQGREDIPIPVVHIPIKRYLENAQRIYVAVSVNGFAGWDISCWSGPYDAFAEEEI